MAGSLGTSLFEVRQGPGDWSDAPTRDLALLLNVGADIRSSRVDLGSGRLNQLTKSGEFIVTPPGSATDIQVDTDHHLMILAIPYARLCEAKQGCGLPTDGCFGRLHAQYNADPEVPRLMARLWAAMLGPNAGSALLSDALVLQLVSRLIDMAVRQNRPASGGLAAWQVRAAQEMIRDRLAETVTLADLAEAVGLSQWHFCRAFGETVGVTPHRAQVLARLDHARDRLAKSREPITEIAFDCGYQSSQAFARVFRKEVGTTPAAYRREVQT